MEYIIYYNILILLSMEYIIYIRILMSDTNLPLTMSYKIIDITIGYKI